MSVSCGMQPPLPDTYIHPTTNRHRPPPKNQPTNKYLVLDVQLLQQLRRALPDAELAGAVDVGRLGLGDVQQGADGLEVGVRPVEDDLWG